MFADAFRNVIKIVVTLSHFAVEVVSKIASLAIPNSKSVSGSRAILPKLKKILQKSTYYLVHEERLFSVSTLKI